MYSLRFLFLSHSFSRSPRSSSQDVVGYVPLPISTLVMEDGGVPVGAVNQLSSTRNLSFSVVAMGVWSLKLSLSQLPATVQPANESCPFVDTHTHTLSGNLQKEGHTLQPRLKSLIKDTHIYTLIHITVAETLTYTDLVNLIFFPYKICTPGKQPTYRTQSSKKLQITGTHYQQTTLFNTCN